VLAALYRRTGPAAEVLTVEEVERPPLGPGEVRVRLRVAGVNPTDWKSRSGQAFAHPFQVPGQDGAGDVVEVGEGVPAGRVGERVWVWFAAARGRQWGTAAQETVVPARQAVPLPADVSYDLGAGLGIPAMTAWHCLFAAGPVRGRSVLVAGGAGAVGNAAVALAARAGAHVVATASSPEKADRARAAGAAVVVDHRSPDAVEQLRSAAPDGFVRIVEVAPHANLELDLAVLAPHGVIASYAGEPVTVPTRPAMVLNARLDFVLVYGVADDALDAAVAGVVTAVAEGVLPPLPSVRFPLSRVAEAHDAVEAGAPGKVLLDLP
jgi:NADPH:quinone reductase